jgi:CubicO group peptidase (beta-lactamase class C family)
MERNEMRRLMRVRTGAFVGAAALVLSVAPIAHAQQAKPEPASLTEVQNAGVKRLKELIEVMNTGDHPVMVSYLKANTIKAPFAGPPGGELNTVVDMVIQAVASTYHSSLGLDLVRVTTHPSDDDAVVGIVRNRLTGDEQYLPVKVEPQAPHRIAWLPPVAPQVVATYGLKRAASVAVTEEERLQEVGAYLKRMGNADVFSGAIVIAREGEPVFAQAYGYADREKKILNTLNTPFLMASMTKLFTGLAIGQLVEQGKLSYDDPLSKFLPDFPDAESAKKIRIKHLLSHTSGLAREGSPIDSSSTDRPTTVKAMVDAFDRKPLAFDPGTRWVYSNMGFVLLGRIIEIVTGQDYYEYMQANVFAPAGATSASFPLLPGNGVAVVPMSYPYEWGFNAAGTRFTNQLGVSSQRGSPAGSSIISALDLIKLSNAMNAGRIVTPETLRLHSSPKPELGATTYGYGFIAGPYLGRPFVGHNGRSFGHCTEFGELRDTPYTIVVLSNLKMDGCRQVTERILRVLRPSAAPGA